jgi:hypothetical protein
MRTRVILFLAVLGTGIPMTTMARDEPDQQRTEQLSEQLDEAQ